MFFYLLLLFVTLPLLELWLLIRIGTVIGAPGTLGLVLLTGVVGAALARREGLRTWARVNASLAHGEIPAQAMLEGLMIFVAGVVLVTPGVITDAMGFLILIPPIRAWLVRRLRAYFEGRVTVIRPGAGFAAPPEDDEFIDVEYRDVTNEQRPRLDDEPRG